LCATFVYFVVNAQEDIINAAPDRPTKIVQYCTVLATPRLLSSGVTIDIEYGESRSIWKDNRLKNEKGKLVKFNTVVVALNYMGENDWHLVNAFPVSTGTNKYTYHYIFKK